jgi:aminoglycoside 6'-N-acetyltransferase
VTTPSAIAGQTVVLRPAAAAHVPAFLEILGHPEIAKWWGGYDLERVRRELLGPHGYAIELAGEVVGLIIYREENDPDHRHAAMDLAVHPDHHGQGFATEAARPLLDLGFRCFGMRRIVGRIEPRNTASARVLDKLGMRQEAHFVENELIRGEWQSEAVYALLAAEWARASRGA